MRQRESGRKLALPKALNARSAPGVTDLMLNPDAHVPGIALMPDDLRLMSVSDQDPVIESVGMAL